MVRVLLPSVTVRQRSSHLSAARRMAAPVASKTKEYRKVITKDCSAAYGQYLLGSVNADDDRLLQIVTIKCIAVTCSRDESVQSPKGQNTGIQKERSPAEEVGRPSHNQSWGGEQWGRTGVADENRPVRTSQD
ncbi:hypothetical protein CJF32_00010195 [Rutstroemia sp. NJR-2017a WRK4]|nr:hypothetical protein CJF32_00010195 [Rutstroemia sp. NJR-2017a WRK4]